ncbi:uncharacterized protein K444DRAFT_522452, partial [Hyaloscypha bicolor E]
AANYGITIDILKRLIANSLEIFGQLILLKQPKILPLEKPDLGTGKDQLILKALRASLLVTILPTGRGKSLVFIVPAILSGSGVTIMVVPYTELKRQLVSRYTNAGLDCKY